MTDFRKKHVFTPLYMSPKRCQCGRDLHDEIHENLLDHIPGERDPDYTPEAEGYARLPAPEKSEREGDQPLPVKNELPFIHDLMKEDVEARKELGVKRYGTPLQAHNGRDTLRDVYEELLDAAVYIRTLMYERDSK